MTPRRYELTDFEWSIIAPLLPNKPRGVPRADDRLVLNGIYADSDEVAQAFRFDVAWGSEMMSPMARCLAGL